MKNEINNKFFLVTPLLITFVDQNWIYCVTILILTLTATSV